MVASTDIKFYVHTNNNAPQLQNAYGSMINVLDACLINGIQIGVVNSLTASGNTVTATFGAAHNLMQYQVIKITGAAQAEFNGEHRILTVPNSNEVTFELAAAPSVSTATGAISASLPPLGWEKPFSSSNPSGGGKAAYRSLNLLLPSRPFLRVVDELDSAYTANYAKYAKVGIVEDMTDIDTMLGVQAPFDPANPNKNWVGTGSGASAINGWAKWYYARTEYEHEQYYGVSDSSPTPNGNRSYLLIGSADAFYILPSVVAGYQDSVSCYGFGAFKSYLQDDSGANFLNASFSYVSAQNLTNRICTYGTIACYENNASNSTVLQRGVGGVPALWAEGRSESFLTRSYSNYYVSGYGNISGSPSSLGQVFLLPIKIHGPSILMGEFPLVKFIPHSKPYNNLQTISIANRKIISKNIMGFAAGANAFIYGSLAFDLGE